MGNPAKPLEQKRAISFQSIWGAGDTTSYEVQSGAYVDYNTSLQVNAVWACVSQSR